VLTLGGISRGKRNLSARWGKDKNSPGDQRKGIYISVGTREWVIKKKREGKRITKGFLLLCKGKNQI